MVVDRMHALMVIIILVFVSGCTKQSIEITEIKSFPIDSTEGIIAISDVTFDRSVSADGNGSVRIAVDKPATVELFETGDIDIENAQLIFRANMKTTDVEGTVYLEMWCSFPGIGEYFSRGVHSPMSGSMDWTAQETPFFLKKGENPDNVRLNVVINGTGTVWVDSIRLMKAPLK